MLLCKILNYFLGKRCNSSSSPSFNNFRSGKRWQKFSIWNYAAQQFDVNSCRLWARSPDQTNIDNSCAITTTASARWTTWSARKILGPVLLDWGSIGSLASKPRIWSQILNQTLVVFWLKKQEKQEEIIVKLMRFLEFVIRLAWKTNQKSWEKLRDENFLFCF